MKVALVHDYLNEAGGAERVLRVLAEMYPEAPIYTAFIKKGTAKKMFADRELRESRWGWLLKRGRLFSYLRFLLPWIWKSMDLSSYDLVITSTSGGYIARGFRVGEQTKVVAYCHTPPKWLYGYETPTGAGRKWWGKLFLWVWGPILRHFDYQSAQRVDSWMANSQEVASRIRKFYRREARVVYPSVETVQKEARSKIKTGDYYLLVSRITRAKGVGEAIEAATRGKFKLKLVGEIVETKMKKVVENAGEWVEYLGRLSDEELARVYGGAKGFLALAKDEDFGITVVEAMQYGVPVLALRSGGYRETVRETKELGQTGVLIDDSGVESVLAGIRKMERIRWDRGKIAMWGQSFSREQFERKVRAVIKDIAKKE